MPMGSLVGAKRIFIQIHRMVVITSTYQEQNCRISKSLALCTESVALGA